MIKLDHLEQIIEQFAAAFAALLKLRRERKTEQAQQLIRETSLSVLGMEYGALTMADAGSTAQLLGHPVRVKGLARLVAEEAELFQDKGEPARAAMRRQLALELYLEAEKMGSKLEGEDAQLVARLREAVEPRDA